MKNANEEQERKLEDEDVGKSFRLQCSSLWKEEGTLGRISLLLQWTSKNVFVVLTGSL